MKDRQQRNEEVARVNALLSTMPRPDSLVERRSAYDEFFDAIAPPSTSSPETVDINGLGCEWHGAGGPAAECGILYFHGGGFVRGSTRSHRHLVAEIARVSGGRALAADYRLAPEHPFPAAVDDAFTLYKNLLDSGYRAKNIVLAGDSAGGALVLSTMLMARDTGYRMPAGGWLISPWVDMEARGSSFTSRGESDPYVRKEYIIELAQYYLGGQSRSLPLAAPIHADLTGLPPLHIQVGSLEVLLDDAVSIARSAGEAGTKATLEIWPEMGHVWHLFWPMLSDAREAIASGVQFAINVTES